MTLIEMDGFLRGKCLPGDMKVNETNAEYLVRKFAEAEAQLTALTSQLESVVAENAALKSAESNLVRNIINDLGDTEFQYAKVQTPATAAFLAEVRASGVPEGWKLVPEQMHIDATDIESICDRCGNGDELYGEFTDGILWVGELSNDGVIKYGLNVASADYPDEGSITVYEFEPPVRQGGAV